MFESSMTKQFEVKP